MKYDEKTRHTKVCKLQKTLYGLRISPKRWNMRLSEVAEKAGLKSHDTEPCLFTWREGKNFLILLLYVDDMLIASNKSRKLQDVKTVLRSEFEMTDLGAPEIFLGIEIKRTRKKQNIVLKQEIYVKKILTRFKFEEMHPQRTPMVTTQVSNKERKQRGELNERLISNDNQRVDNSLYREAFRSLLYLATAIRPDIMYAVNVLSRHQLNPTNNEWQMVKQVFRYLKDTKGLGLTFVGKQNNMEAYLHASFADCKGSLTTCGYILKLYGDAVAWKTRKQSYVALSTCKAEYVAKSEACQELIALDTSLRLILNTTFCPITLWCDNKAAEATAKMSGSGKLRHMTEIKEHYILECV